MRISGESDPFMVEVRATLLDALTALGTHLDDVVVIGAQAIYLHTGAADVAIAEYTSDADLAIDPRELADDPRIETAMVAAGFVRAPGGQPGAWQSPSGIPVDLIVPDRLAGPGRRSARIPPHGGRTARRSVGLEASVVDRDLMAIPSLAPADPRSITASVAGPAALMVAKLHKIADRLTTSGRLIDKDAHDLYRLLRAIDTRDLRDALIRLLADPLSQDVTHRALDHLEELFAGAGSRGAVMAGRAESGVGDPAQVALAVSALATDLLGALPPRTDQGSER